MLKTRFAVLALVRFALALTAVFLAATLHGPRPAEAQTWSTVTVHAVGRVGAFNAIAVDGNGNPMISYFEDVPPWDLRFATCDVSLTDCDHFDDWTRSVAYDIGSVGWHSSIAVDANGDPLIAYRDAGPEYLMVSMCDISTTKCDDVGDWDNVVVDDASGTGYWTSITVGANGDPMVAYYDRGNMSLKFAVCQRSQSNCDQTGNWKKVVVDTGTGFDPFGTAIAISGNGDPMISYHETTTLKLKWAICDISMSMQGNCSDPSDWSKGFADDSFGSGAFSSMATDANGNPVISYAHSIDLDLKFATCDLSTTNCLAPGNWVRIVVDAKLAGNSGTSIAVDTGGHRVISYYGDAALGNAGLKFAKCDQNCDQFGSWTTDTVDSSPNVGQYNSIAVSANGTPMISYFDVTNEDLKFAMACPVGDSDCDGWTTADEGFIGTDPNVACDDGAGLPDWPPDFNDDKRVTIADVLALKPAFGSQSGQPNYDQRLDLNADGRITIADVLLMKDVFNQSCT